MNKSMNEDIASFLRKLKRKPRIALVKQNIYTDLYNCEFNASALDKLFSSNQRTGSVGLIAAFNPDFFMVEVQPDDECSVWTEKYDFSTHFTKDGLLATREREFYQKNGSYQKQSNLTVDIYSIDWNIYDYIFTYDYAIPSRVIKAFDKPVWCNYVTEGFMPAFKSAIIRLPEGYSINFNHHFRPDYILEGSKAVLYEDVVEANHSLDCPYFIQYYGCFHDILNISLTTPKTGIVLDPDTKNKLSEAQIQELKKIGPVREIDGCVWHVIDALINSKYYLRLSERYVLGNSSIEAVASGCLFLTSPIGIKNSYLMDEQAIAHGQGLDNQFISALNAINNFEKYDALYLDVISRQREKLDYLCFKRPLTELFKMRNLLL